MHQFSIHIELNCFTLTSYGNMIPFTGYNHSRFKNFFKRGIGTSHCQSMINLRTFYFKPKSIFLYRAIASIDYCLPVRRIRSLFHPGHHGISIFWLERSANVYIVVNSIKGQCLFTLRSVCQGRITIDIIAGSTYYLNHLAVLQRLHIKTHHRLCQSLSGNLGCFIVC